MSLRLWPILTPLLCLAACAGRPDKENDEPAPPTRQPAASLFDPAGCGAIAGTILWKGEPPRVEPFRSIDEPLTDQPRPQSARDWPNPNAPRIDPATDALAGAVVLLRGVDPRKARPWDHPPVRVTMRGQAFVVSQDAASNVGFARVGDGIDFASSDERLHVVQARGAAFFALTLPKPDRPRTRHLPAPGVVELASGCGYFWMRAYVHVSEHPYLTRTDAAGRFRLEGVPAGDYDLVAWHPNWRVGSEQRNPDLFRVQQVRFAAPLESSRRIHVEARKTTGVDLSLGE